MKFSRVTSNRLLGFMKVLAVLVVFKVTCGVVFNNRHYFPPNFESEFLTGRRHYFYGPYQYAFFSHIVAGPLSLFLGLVLVSKTLRRHWPIIHRWAGRLQVMLVAFVVAPAGFAMAFRAEGGRSAVSGFGTLAVFTAATAVMGYVSARRRKFAAHQRWMFRCFLLLASAVVLRLIAGISITTGIESQWIYPASAWLSWLIPMAVNEVIQRGGIAKQKANAVTTIPQ